MAGDNGQSESRVPESRRGLRALVLSGPSQAEIFDRLKAQQFLVFQCLVEEAGLWVTKDRFRTLMRPVPLELSVEILGFTSSGERWNFSGQGRPSVQLFDLLGGHAAGRELQVQIPDYLSGEERWQTLKGQPIQGHLLLTTYDPDGGKVKDLARRAEPLRLSGA